MAIRLTGMVGRSMGSGESLAARWNHADVVLVDAFPIMHRCFHAQRADEEAEQLTQTDGRPPRRALVHFLQVIYQLRSKFARASHMCVVYDPPSPSFRAQISAGYKTHRPPQHELLRPQLALVAGAVEALNVAACTVEQYEADDVIATLARQLAAESRQTVVVSPDKDLMQTLQWPNVRIYEWFAREFRTAQHCVGKFGVPPSLVHEAQALAGDSSDGYRGVAGIGPKRAAQLLTAYGSIEGVYANLHELPERIRQTLHDGRAELEHSLRLARLVDTISPLPVTLDDIAVRPIDPQRIRRFCEETHAIDFLRWWEGRQETPSS